MATASTAIETVAEAGGFLKATVFRAARFLREIDPTLWPQGSQGRGRAAQVYPHHLVNLMLALSSNPISHAADSVEQLRQFVPVGDPCEAFPNDTPLGEVLDKRINDIASGFLTDIYMKISITRTPSSYTLVHLEDSGKRYQSRHYRSPEGLPAFRTSEIFSHFVVSQDFLQVLALLWNDTKRELSLNTDYKTQEG